MIKSRMIIRYHLFIICTLFLSFKSDGQQYHFSQDTLKYSSSYAVVNGLYLQDSLSNETLIYGLVHEFYNDNSIKSEYTVKEGFKKHGIYTAYYSENNIKEIINFYRSKRIDLFYQFHENQKIACIGEYTSLQNNNIFTQHCDTIDYVDSLTMEPFSIIACEVKSFKDGEWKYFDDQGNLLRVEFFQNDTLIEIRKPE